MPLPTELPLSDADAYQRVTEMARQTLASAEAMRESILRGGVRVDQLCDFFDFLRGKKDDGEKLATVAGIETYAKSVNGDDYSITQNFGAVLAAGTAITEWIIANVPSDGQGGVVTRRFVEGGKTAYVIVSPQSISPIVSLIDALIAAIKG